MAFLLKLALVPVVIFLLSIISKKFGDAVGGMFAGFPIISGPILLFLSIQHGLDFGQEVASTMIVGVAGVAVYALVYSKCSQYFRWYTSLFLASLFFFTSSLMFTYIPLTAMERLFFTAIVIVICYKLIPIENVDTKSSPIRYEMIYRILAGISLLFLVTFVSGAVGPEFSGVISSFPVTASIIPTFIHGTQGKDGAITFLRNLTFSLFSMCIFFTYLSNELNSLGIAVAFSSGIVFALIFQGGLVRMRTYLKRGK